MVHEKQPLCGVIIGNENFDTPNLHNLDGIDIDVEKMAKFLRAYGIHCNEERNIKAEEMTATLERLKRWDLSKYSGLIVTILTHGGEGNTLYGSDGKFVHLQKLADIYNSVNCKGLRDKPKIFITSACRGHKQDSAVSQGRRIPPSLRDSKCDSTATYGYVHIVI